MLERLMYDGGSAHSPDCSYIVAGREEVGYSRVDPGEDRYILED